MSIVAAGAVKAMPEARKTAVSVGDAEGKRGKIASSCEAQFKRVVFRSSQARASLEIPMASLRVERSKCRAKQRRVCGAVSTALRSCTQKGAENPVTS